MPYTQPTLSDAIAALAARLNDQATVHWVNDELKLYLQESLRTWNAWTAHFRDQASFTTTPGDAFYDLPVQIPTLRQQSVSNWDLVTAIQYALQEPATPAAWSGTDQFALDQLSTAIQRRRDQFLRETGAVVTRALITYGGPPVTGPLQLPEEILYIRRVAWRPTATQLLRPLTRTDEWGANAYAPSWSIQPTAPRAYSVSVTPPLSMQLIPPTSNPGTLDLVSVNKGAQVAQSVDASLGIPNDWAWVVKWGALADLLQGDGLALDPQRAAYCEARWQQGIGLAKSASVVLTAWINETPVRIGSLSDADSYNPLWQLVPDVPRTVLLAGQTLLALTPPPGSVGGPWTITLDVVRNAPIPSDAADILQISQDVYDSILDYAQHLALFKEGAGQLQLAQALLDRVGRAAGVDLSLQQAMQPARAPLLDQTTQDEHVVARELTPVVTQ